MEGLVNQLRFSMVNVDREWLFQELRQSLKTLAAPGDQALATLPDRVVKADELALDYDNFVQAVLQNFGSEFTSDQSSKLSRINELLSLMSGATNADLWTDDAVRSNPRWEEVRREANEAIRLLGWNP